VAEIALHCKFCSSTDMQADIVAEQQRQIEAEAQQAEASA
jgi:hypothetical protein